MVASERLGTRSSIKGRAVPEGTSISLETVTTADGSSAPGVLFSVDGADTVATLMHPRLDTSRNYLIPFLLEAGISVWSQGTRSMGNDVALVHEEALLDAAAGFTHLRERGFAHVVAVGVSGGATLYAYYLQQASREPVARVAATPGGRPTKFAEAEFPAVDAAVFVAPHPGQGQLLLGCIDPAVADEADPVPTVTHLDLFDPSNGFKEPPVSSAYSEAFIAEYRAAQRRRVGRLDAIARQVLEDRSAAKARAGSTGALAERRAGVASRLITVYRTDADPRTVDLSLDPSDRPYGSIYGRRPDVVNFGVQGFGRVTTPEAWLSTWSGISSRARFVDAASEVRLPTLFVEYTGDQATFPSVSAEMFAALASDDKTHERVAGTHFGGPIRPEETPGGVFSADVVVRWLSARFPSRRLPA